MASVPVEWLLRATVMPQLSIRCVQMRGISTPIIIVSTVSSSPARLKRMFTSARVRTARRSSSSRTPPRTSGRPSPGPCSVKPSTSLLTPQPPFPHLVSHCPPWLLPLRSEELLPTSTSITPLFFPSDCFPFSLFAFLFLHTHLLSFCPTRY